MNARRVTAASGAIHAAQKTRQTAAGIAMALEAAGLLQSPESAAELVELRARVAELETAVAHALAPHVKFVDSAHCEADSEPWPCPTVSTLAPAGWPLSDGPAPGRQFERLGSPVEDPHDSPLHHTYAVPRDLPEVRS
ncbi:hypothetical protein OG987_13185 [Streptomyces sp. NBC_01620]|uniref:hypothetical protein n=1 Tax=Streptomyces sp. NBC_01620 TaxID=2975902 RepID=UPI003862F3BE|nr:hypothetical protein OG987_13185 [Streptomyces sp. NBC_01620]